MLTVDPIKWNAYCKLTRGRSVLEVKGNDRIGVDKRKMVDRAAVAIKLNTLNAHVFIHDVGVFLNLVNRDASAGPNTEETLLNRSWNAYIKSVLAILKGTRILLNTLFGKRIVQIHIVVVSIGLESQLLKKSWVDSIGQVSDVVDNIQRDPDLL